MSDTKTPDSTNGNAGANPAEATAFERHGLVHLGLYVAAFRPCRTDDLRPGSERFIGKTLTWQAVWVIEEGPYEGEIAMSPRPIDLKDMPTFDSPPFCWTPHSDLACIERVHREHGMTLCG